MNFKELQFQESDFTGKDIASLPDRVVGSAEELKARFDYIAKEMLALGRFNELLALLAGEGAAGALGFSPTESVPAGTVQQAIEALSGQLRAAAVGQLPVGSVAADRLAEGAALGNLAPGSLGAEYLAPGAALENLRAGSVTGEKLEPGLLENLKSSVCLESLTNLLEDRRLEGEKRLEIKIPVNLRNFLAGSGGRVVVRFAPAGWQCAQLEIRHHPVNGTLDYLLWGGCAQAAEVSSPRDSWQASWLPREEALFYYDSESGAYLGLHSLMAPGSRPDPGDRLLTPVLESGQLTLPFVWTAETQRILKTRILVEVWR